jgi:SHS2 domain-containing protein
MGRRYEMIDHTADIVIRAYGSTLDDALAEAAHAMFAIITDAAPVARERRIGFTVEGIDRESLLVNFLSRLIVIHEIERLVLDHFEVTLTSESSLQVVCYGEPFDAARHGQGIHVKGVTYHLLEIRDASPGADARVQVLFDI